MTAPNPFMSHVLRQFYSSCVHTMYMIDQAAREVNGAEGVDGVLNIRSGPFDPSVLFEQFSARAGEIRTLTREDLPGTDPIALGTIQTALDEEIIPAFSVACEGWACAMSSVEAFMEGRIAEIDAHELGSNLQDMSLGLQSARDEIVMQVLPNTRFLMLDQGMKPL